MAANHFQTISNLLTYPSSYALPLFIRTLPSAIKTSTILRSLPIGKQLHSLSVITGISSDPFVESSLIHMYLKCGCFNHAHHLFDKMPQKDVVSYSAIISNLASHGHVSEALNMLDNMQTQGVDPNLITWNGLVSGFNRNGRFRDSILIVKRMHFEGFGFDVTSVSSGLSACGDLEELPFGTQIHGYVVKHGIKLDGCVSSALIDMYGKCSCVEQMLQVFQEVESSMEVGSCNAILTGLSRNGQAEKAMNLFKKFQKKGVEMNVVSWTSMVACCAQNGMDVEALELFREMQAFGVKPNLVTIPSMLPACANIAALMHGRSTHCYSLKSSMLDNVYVGSALIDMYAKCGKIKAARTVFDIMPSRNTVSWSTIIGGYAMHGKAKEAIELFEMMKKSEQKPDFITFTCVLSACSQAGLGEEGKHYFDVMQREYKVKARREHYACMVSLMGRCGKLEEAFKLIEDMPFEPDGCVWGALLNSCRVHGNVELGEVAANKLFALEPENAGNYVLLSNIYAANGMWSGVDRMRDTMKVLGIYKEVGSSWIEEKNKLHMLLAGDKCHPQIGEIMEKLEKLSREMSRNGYNPDMNYVLQDVEEQEKEHILFVHSERLAVALGLVNTSPGTALRVIKNLRICGDCHMFMKFVSSFEKREIFVRDTNRFHHFRDGSCSCGDHW